MSAPHVLVFDSGVGGLSIAACLRTRLPGVRLSYLADTAGFPYGDQPEATVIHRCVNLVERLMADVPVDLVVVACNTASTVVLPALRERLGIPVVGVVPAIKPAAALSMNGRLGVLATPATVRRPYTDDLILRFAAHCDVTRVGHPGLVRWAEDKVAGQPVPLEALREAVRPLGDAGVDTVVLGCTHYPLIRDELAIVLPEVRHWVDSGEAIARRVAFLLQEAGLDAAGSLKGCEMGMTARFSGAAPAALEVFLPRLGLEPGPVRDQWPGSTAAP
ncbi:glutamate racemase [Marinobacter halodurans]|uniref:Glutamate racemase n=1 Tax=Marinobacter halodurans TaxID=2528979 RepID=A0ABY1ZN13_9GAMM|nr:glutamate racemase [Marinobacter halodurans]TBW57884.1 glutamate racemase [Marinobacter halodurans]